MRAVYAVETGSWDKLGEVNVSGGMLPAVAALTARGILELRQGQAGSARKTLAQAQAKLSAGSAAAAPAMTMAMPASTSESKAPEIMVHELEALLLYADGKKDGALQMLSDAAAAEDAMPFEFGPPMPVKPVHELYGEVLLAAGNSREARKQFQKTLERCPKRRIALQGLSQAEQEMKRSGLPE
jgi:predicted negative regulator of RcsB-dependent stress response